MHAKLKPLRIENFILYITLICYLVDIGNLKYVVAMLGAACLFLMLFLRNKQQGAPVFKFNDTFLYEFKWLFFVIVGLAAITVVLQIMNGFDSYAINEVIYYITPLFFVFSYLQVTRGKYVDHIVKITFFITAIIYLFKNITKFSLSNFFSVSFLGSYSPFESDLAFIFTIYIFYFIYKKKTGYAIFAWLLSYIAMKRIAFIAATILIVWMIGARLFKGSVHPSKSAYIKRKFAWIIIVCFILLSVLISSLLNDEFQSWFLDLTGIDIDTFMLGRFTRLELVANNFDSTGLGATTTYLSRYFTDLWNHPTHDNYNLHNDIFKIFAECGILGTSIFTIGFFKATKFRKSSIIMMVYLMIEMVFNHLLGAGRVEFWIMTYLILFSLNRDESIQKERIVSKDGNYLMQKKNNGIKMVIRS